jgi:hypothetical protein
MTDLTLAQQEPDFRHQTRLKGIPFESPISDYDLLPTTSMVAGGCQVPANTCKAEQSWAVILGRTVIQNLCSEATPRAMSVIAHINLSFWTDTILLLRLALSDPPELNSLPHQRVTRWRACLKIPVFSADVDRDSFPTKLIAWDIDHPQGHGQGH